MKKQRKVNSRNNHMILMILVVVVVISSLVVNFVIFSNVQDLLVPKIAGQQSNTGVTTVDVSDIVVISVVAGTPIAFPALPPLGTDDTTDNNPPPFTLRNNGNLVAEVAVFGTALFGNAPTTSTAYEFSTREGEVGSVTIPANHLQPRQPLPIAPTPQTQSVDCFQFIAVNDEIFFDVYIAVPDEELGGSKSSTVTFVGAQTFEPTC